MHDPVAGRAALAPELVSVGEFSSGEAAPKRFDFAYPVPWFIIGFPALVACRSLVPTAPVAQINRIATLLTFVFIAARTVTNAGGGKVTTAVLPSLFGLGAISLALLAVLHIG